MIAFKDLFNLFYPKLCVNCNNQLTLNEEIICVFCRHDLPLTHFNSFTKNKVTKTFYGRVRIEKGYSLLFYRKENSTQKIIQELKYKGNEEIGTFFGNFLGEIILKNNEFNDVDFIIPVPLHPKKLKKRGYNQVAKFGKILSKHLKTPYKENILTRASSTKTQTLKARFERFTNTDTQFLLTNKSYFKNKHVLLIDDVITTGATLEACIKELQKTSGIKVSILTMAYTD